MRRVTILLVALAALYLAACASTPKTSATLASDLRNAEMTAVVDEPEPFSLTSAGKVAAGSLFGLTGGAVAGKSMMTAGEKMIADYAIADPAIEVRDRLAAELNTRFGSAVHESDVHPKSDAELRTMVPSGLALDVKTTGWQLIYYPTDWTHHFLLYSGRARVTRADTGAVLWQGKCLERFPDPDGQHRTVDEYRANDGELLKTKMKEAAAACVTHMLATLPAGS